MLIRLAAVAVFTLVPVAGAIPTAPVLSHAMARSGGYFPSDAILSWSGQRFTLIRIDSYDRFESEYMSLLRWMEGNPDRVAGLQAAVRQNRALASALRARSVQINNIGAARASFSGNLTFYLR